MSTPGPTQPSSLAQIVHDHLDAELQYLNQKWPESLSVLDATSNVSGTEVAIDPRLAAVAEEVSRQEKDELFAQLQAISVLPPTKLDPTTGQLLQESLSLLLNLPVSFSNQSNSIPIHNGVMSGDPYKLHAFQQNSTPQAIHSAGRDFEKTTWEYPNSSTRLTLGLDELKQWSILLAASFWVAELSANAVVQPSWIWQPVIVINPISQRAATAWITGIQTHRMQRYQWSAAPPLSRWLQLWSSTNEGRVVVVPLLSAQVTPQCWDFSTT